MRKYLGEYIFNNDNVEIKNIDSKLSISDSFYLDYRVETNDFDIMEFRDLEVTLLVDGEIYSNDFNTHINDSKFLKGIISEIKKGNREILKELNGSFNLIIYDHNKNKLDVLTDRFFTRPIFYYLSKDRVVFSNRMTEISKCLPGEISLNKKAIMEFFSLQMVFGNKTFIQNINAFESATLNEFFTGEVRKFKYWKFKQNIDKSFEEKNYVSKLSKLMREIINFKTNDSKRYGILLSGGLDSRAILAADSNKRITEVFTLGDSYNIECRISEKVANHREANFNYIQREIDHYYNILGESVEIGDGMYNFLNGHFIGYTESISKKVDIIFNGSLIEQFWQGSKFFKHKIKIGRYKVSSPILIKNFYNVNTTNLLLNNFPRKVKGVDKIFNKQNRETINNELSKSIKEMLISNFGSESIDPQEAVDYIACDSYGRYCSHLNQLCINDKINYRTIFDNRIIDLLLKVPIKYRSNGYLLKKSILKLDKKLGDIPLSGSRVKMKRSSYVHWFFTNLTNSFYKILKTNSYKAKNSSWPNYAKLIIENKKIQSEILSVIKNKEIISDEIFDRKYILTLFNDHLEGKKNNERILFQILTFGQWFKSLKNM
ncbi:asparagine synthase-related protein [Bacillus sp. 7894-2]|uniref:asparagine synthase-related protein n=1 Tax=Bacillus sp. 7894-2 TaxID=2021695 RepID=UPI000BA693E3|nr:asparagine synthase-related protein [Bacillus sp. 7894-2]PAE25791.1 hypothetical protein CHI10_05780 [Bacillus sp. 7894-2]